MKQATRYFLSIIITLSVISPVLAQTDGLVWGINEGQEIHYLWEYTGDPFLVSGHQTTVSYTGDITVTIIRLSSLNTYDIMFSVDYGFTRSPESYPAGLTLYHLHPVPVGNWSLIESSFHLLYPTATIDNTESQFTVSFTLLEPDSTPFNISMNLKFTYSKTDGVVNSASESWTNATSGAELFTASLERVYGPMNYILPILLVLGVLAIGTFIYLRSRAVPELHTPYT